MGFSDLQIIFLFFLQENNLRKSLIPFIGVKYWFMLLTETSNFSSNNLI
jgi:hypothetical protein